MSKNNFRDFSLITIGVLLVAISVVYFFEPNNIAAGGISGLAIIINHYFPAISIGPLVLIMDSILYFVRNLFIQVWCYQVLCGYWKNSSLIRQQMI